MLSSVVNTPNSNFYVETRSTSVAASPIMADVVPGTLALQSSYSCTAGTQSCPTNLAPADAASCSATLNTIAVRLP